FGETLQWDLNRGVTVDEVIQALRSAGYISNYSGCLWETASATLMDWKENPESREELRWCYRSKAMASLPHYWKLLSTSPGELALRSFLSDVLPSFKQHPELLPRNLWECTFFIINV